MKFDFGEEVAEKDEIVFNVSGGKNLKHSMESNPTTRWSQLEKDKMVMDAMKNSPTLTDKEIEELRQAYEYVYMNDFGDDDDYNLTEEERARKNKYNLYYRKIRQQKKGYKKLDMFVRAYRDSLEFLRAVAEHNYIYHPDDFIIMVLKGEIKVNGLKFPRYLGKDKKLINWNYVIDYILDTSMDLNDLKSYLDTDDTFEDLDEIDETIQEIIDTCKPLEEKSEGIKYFDSDYMEQKPGVVVYDKSNKQFKKIMKENPSILKINREMKKKQKARSQLYQMSYDLHEWENEMDDVIKKDKARGYDDKPPVYHGSYSDKDALEAYLYDLDAWERKNSLIKYRGRVITQDQYNDIMLRDTFEKAGFNVRKMLAFKSQDDFEKKDKKLAKKTKKLRKRLIDLQERKDARTYGKKKAKKMRKEKEKDEKKKKRQEKSSQKHRKKIEDNFDKMLLDSVDIDKKYSSFAEYENDMLDFRMGAG